MRMNVDAYLERIGADRATGLSDLHRLHQTAVPFENLSIHLGEPVSLASGDLYDKIVGRRRGGFCYELNGLFALLLEQLGHEVTRLGARVDGGPPFDHLTLLVDGVWLVDVGFGAHSTYPLRFDSRSPQTDPGGTFTIVPAPDGDVDVLKDGNPENRIERRGRGRPAFGPTCWWQTPPPAPPSPGKTICPRLDGDGRITISGRTFIETRSNSRTEHELD